MASSKRNPAALGARTGLGNVKAVVGEDSSEITQTLFAFQAEFVARRFHVPLAQAELIATLAFGGSAR